MTTSETKDRVLEAKKYRQHILDKLTMETSSVETFKPGDDRNGYVEALENRIDRLKAIMDEMTTKSKSLEKDARAEFEHEKAKLERHYVTSKAKLNEIRQSGEDAWKNLHDGALNAWEDLANGVKNAISKFR